MLMAAVFVGILVINFLFVFAVAYAYESDGGAGAETLVYESDSNAQFGHYGVSDNYIFYPYTNITTQVREITNVPPQRLTAYELTPAYLGNNTWGVSAPPLGVTPYDHISGVIVQVIPNLDSFIMTRIVFNETMPAVDVHCGLTILHFPSEPFGLTTYGSANPASQETNLIFSDPVVAPQWSFSYNVPLTKALRIYDLAQGIPQGNMAAEVGWTVDNPAGGLGTYAMTWSLQIYGRPVSAWSLTDSLALAIGGGVFLNFVAIVYMTDEIDIGGFRKDIPRLRRRK